MTEDGFNSSTPPPKTVGCWIVGGWMGWRFYVERRPRWLTRTLLRLVEIDWRDGSMDSHAGMTE